MCKTQWHTLFLRDPMDDVQQEMLLQDYFIYCLLFVTVFTSSRKWLKRVPDIAL